MSEFKPNKNGIKTEYLIQERCKNEIYHVKDTPWENVRKDILFIEHQQFGQASFTEKDFIDTFNDPESTIVLMRDSQTNKIIGYTYAIPLWKMEKEDITNMPRNDEGKKTAYILNTAFHSDYQGHHLVGKLVGRLEQELKKKGFEFIERDAAVAQNYAAKIEKFYQDRIVYKSNKPHDSDWGPQQFFRIKL